MSNCSSSNNTIQAVWIALGSLFSVGFSIVSAMILSRYFSVAEYGLYKQVIYVYTTLNGFFMLGLPKAFSYFLPKTPLNQAQSLINKINNLFYLLGGVFTALLFFGAPLIEDFMNAPGLAKLLKIFSPVPFFMMPTMGLEGILATYRKTKLISAYIVSTRMAMLLCICLPVVVYDASCEIAIWGFVLSSFISFIISIRLRNNPVKDAGYEKTTESYKSIFAFCFPLFVASIWGILINSTDQFFISRYFGNEVFAIFSNGSMELPFVGMIIGATSTVLTPLFTKHLHEHANLVETVLPMWKNAFAKSAMIIYPLTIFCMFDAISIMTIMYGEAYVESAPFFQIKLLTYFFKVIVFYSLIVALGAVKFYQKLFMTLFFILVVFEYLCVKLFANPLLITAIHVTISIASCIVMMIFIARKLNVKVMTLVPMRQLAKVLIASIISCIFYSAFKYYFYSDVNLILRVSIDCFLMIGFYTLFCFILKLNYWDILKPIFKR